MSKDDYAIAVIAEGRRRGITQRGIVIALATTLVESNLLNYANSKVPESLAIPHDAVGSDGFSVGIFQQQVRKGDNGQWWWGSAQTCMNPALSAGLFYDRLARLNYNGPNSPGSYAQSVQQSAFPDRYDQRMGEAQNLYDRLAGAAPPPPVQSTLRANVEATKAFIRARVGNPYVYGGALSNNVKQGTDCSEVWQTVLEMVEGRWVQGRQSEGATTESYRYIPIGGVGPFGTIRVARPEDVPADAVAKIGLHHGPGGGANSHMWGELDGMRIESAGSKGLVTNPNARPFNDSYGTAWCYLPGPIDSEGDGDLSAEAERMIREMYDEYKKEKRGPSRSFLATDGALVESPLGFLYNMDGNIWTQQLTWAYLFHVPLALEVVESVAKNGSCQGTWVASNDFNAWLNEFGQAYCQGLVEFKAALVSKLSLSAQKSVTTSGETTVSASAIAAEVASLLPAADNSALTAAYAENARLREDNARLQATVNVPVAYSPPAESAVEKSSGDIAGSVLDSVKEWTSRLLTMDAEERGALSTSLKALRPPTGSQ